MRYYKLLLLMLPMVFSCKKSPVSRVSSFRQLASDSAWEVKESLPSFRKEGNFTRIVIPRDTTGLSADVVAASYTFIPLETTDESLIGEIDKLETDDGYIFICDRHNNKALQFSQNGKFIRTIGKRGRGPNEYSKISSMSIDKLNKQICISDEQGLKILFYDYNGQCVKEEPKYYSCSNIEFVGDLRVVFLDRPQNTQIPALDLHQICIANNKGIPLYADFPISKKRATNFYWRRRYPIQKFSDGVYFSEILSDTIWKINQNGITPAFFLDFQGNNIRYSAEEVENMNNELYEKRIDGKEHFQGTILVTNKFVYAEIVRKDNFISQLIYSRKSGKTIRYLTLDTPANTSQMGNYYYDVIPNHFVFQDSLFVAVMQPRHMVNTIANSVNAESYQKLQPKDRKMLESLKEEDNPVLMLTKFRDF